MKKNVFRSTLTLALVVTMIVTILLPTTSWANTKQQPTSSTYPELTPEMEKYMEKEFWDILLEETHIDSAYMRGTDGFILRDEVEVVASFVLEEMIYYPDGDPKDPHAREWQRFWANFFSRIARGEFSNKELRRQLRRVRRKARKNKVKFW